VTQVTLVFENGDERVHIPCNRVSQVASDVQDGDYIACPYSGFVHVHAVKLEGKYAVLIDCHEHEHMYPLDKMLEIARPMAEVQA